jgi:hypothetical protein
MFLSPVSPLHYQGLKYAHLFSQPVQSNPSEFFPAFEAPAETLLGARADEELTRIFAAREEKNAEEAIGYYYAADYRQRGEARRHALRTIRGYREAKARAHAARKVLFRMLNASVRQEMAA